MAAQTTPETVFVRGTGGAIYEMDVPTYGHALERWENALAKGDLTIVPEAHWVERGDGSKYLVAGPAGAPAQTETAAQKRKRLKAEQEAAAKADEPGAAEGDESGDAGDDAES